MAMRQPEETTLWGKAQRKILDGVFLPASESQIVTKRKEVRGKKRPWVKNARFEGKAQKG